MASSSAGDFDDDHSNSESRVRQAENIKVYTRKGRKKTKTTSNNNYTTSHAHNSAIESTISGYPIASPAAIAIATTSDDKVVAASIPPSISNSLVTRKHLGNNIPRQCEDALVTEDVDSSELVLQVQSPNRENTESQTAGDVADDSSLLKQSHQLAGLRLHQGQPPLLSENNISSHGTGEGHSCQTLEPKNLESLSPRPNNDEACNPKEARSHHTDVDELLTSGIGPQNLGEVQSPLFSVNNLPNRPEYATAQLQGENKLTNDEISTAVMPKAPSGIETANLNGIMEPLTITRVNDRIIFSLSKAAQKGDINKLRRKLEYELDQVRRVVNQLEGKELQLASSKTKVGISNLNNIHSGMAGGNIVGYIPPQRLSVPSNVVKGTELVRITSDVSMMGHRETVPMRFSRVNSDVGTILVPESRPYSRQLSVAVIDNTHDTGEIVDKEKRTPKANQYYRNSEFLLGKDRLPSESNKKLKKFNWRKHIDQTEQVHGFEFGFVKNKKQLLKSCSSLLQRLMKHKHGWVFNDPVDAKALGLHDYHVIIKHPMDLGTIKTRLSQNWYKTPRDFAADVRLVFYNAMTYNPKGQDVHIMAEELSGIFEEKWAVTETKYNPYLKYHVYQDAGLPTPTSRRFYPQPHVAPNSSTVSTPVSIHAFAPAAAPSHILAPSTPTMLNVDRTQTTALTTVDFRTQRPHVGKTPVPKKPKAKDPNKRDMTYEEKQRLSTNLQVLASEKLEAIIQIIKKNDTALSQRDDEIEVDIDSVDPETLWELDRFVTNYKKSLSKKKRRAEIALQARTVSNQSASFMNSAPAVPEVQSKSGTDEIIDKGSSPPAVEGEKHDNNVDGFTSSSSSSSDSGSSSSDSESDKSAADGFGAG